jgi:hypothetical protein
VTLRKEVAVQHSHEADGEMTSFFSRYYYLLSMIRLLEYDRHSGQRPPNFAARSH